MLEKIKDYCSVRGCNNCVLLSQYDYLHCEFSKLSDHALEMYCKLIDISENYTDSVKKLKNCSNCASFYVKGNCVDDLFHILVSNGYRVQLSNTDTPNQYRVDVIIESEVDNG